MSQKEYSNPENGTLTSNHIVAGVVGLAALGFGAYLMAQPGDAATGRGDRPSVETPISREESWAQRHPRVTPTTKNEDADARSFFVEAPDMVKLGWGWSQNRAEPIPTVCVDFAPDHPDNAQDARIEISEVRDSYTLSKAMDISASASVKAVGYNASGKASFAKNSSVSSDSVSYLVSAEVLNAAEFAGPVPPLEEGGRAAVRLTPAAARLARTDLEAFQDICGEGYVSVRKNGARAYMLATTRTSSREDRETVRASVEGQGWGVKVAAAANGSTKANTQNFERTLSFYQQGGNAFDDTTFEVEATTGVDAEGKPTREKVTVSAADLPENANEAIGRIKKLAQAAAKASKTFEIQITPYQVLENFPRGKDILPEEVEQDEIVAMWGAYSTLYTDLRRILEEPQGYAAPIRTCETDDDGVADCGVTFVPLEAGSSAMALTENIQDMALIARDQIEDAAALCIEHEEFCEFDTASVRSPYSIRANMPILVPTVARPANTAAQQARTAYDQALADFRTARTMDALLKAAIELQVAAATVNRAGPDRGETVDVPDPESLSAEDHLALHLREPSQGRCVYGARTPGCITNAEIRRWAARTGLFSHVTGQGSVFRQAILECGISESQVLTGEADDPKAPVVWFPASVRIGSDGLPDCAETAEIIANRQ